MFVINNLEKVVENLLMIGEANVPHINFLHDFVAHEIFTRWWLLVVHVWATNLVLSTWASLLLIPSRLLDLIKFLENIICLFPPPCPPKDFLFNTHKSMPFINTTAIRLAKVITNKISLSLSLSQQTKFSYSTWKTSTTTN